MNLLSVIDFFVIFHGRNLHPWIHDVWLQDWLFETSFTDSLAHVFRPASDRGKRDTSNKAGFLGAFGTLRESDLQQKSSRLRWCFADIIINQSGDWYEFHEHVILWYSFVSLRPWHFQRSLVVFFYWEPTLSRTNRHRGAWVSVCDICVAHEVRDLYATWHGEGWYEGDGERTWLR